MDPRLQTFLMIVAILVAIWSTNAMNKRSNRADREHRSEELRAMLDEMVVKKIAGLDKEVRRLWNYQGSVDRRITATDRAHWELVGFLKGKQCLSPDVCANRDALTTPAELDREDFARNQG